MIWDVLHWVVFGVGAIAIALAATYGLLEAAFWIVDKILYTCGLWQEFHGVTQRLVRERRDRAEKGNE